MIVIETCPKCGGNLETLVIATYPPIPKKMCMSCGWYWEGKVEEIVRIPFKDPEDGETWADGTIRELIAIADEFGNPYFGKIKLGKEVEADEDE